MWKSGRWRDVSIKKVLLECGHAHLLLSPTFALMLQWQRWGNESESAWPTKYLRSALYRERPSLGVQSNGSGLYVGQFHVHPSNIAGTPKFLYKEKLGSLWWFIGCHGEVEFFFLGIAWRGIGRKWLEGWFFLWEGRISRVVFAVTWRRDQ